MSTDPAIFEHIRATMLAHVPTPGQHPTAIDGFHLVRLNATNALCEVHFPLIALTVQGNKRTFIGSEEYRYGAGQCIIIGVDTPCQSTVLTASPEQPFLALILALDSNLSVSLPAAPPAAAGTLRGAAIMPAETKVLHAFERLLALLDEPDDIPVMAPLLAREIHHRLLLGPQGGWLHALVTKGTRGNRIADAIGWLRANYRQPLAIADLALRAGMSESRFFRAFRQVTGASPLQFQKTLRLFEAQRLLVLGQGNVSDAAYATGYASVSQFTREYKRQFGAAPGSNARRLRAAPHAAGA